MGYYYGENWTWGGGGNGGVALVGVYGDTWTLEWCVALYSWSLTLGDSTLSLSNFGLNYACK